MNFVFLYSRMPQYFRVCLEHLVSKHPEISIYSFAYQPSDDAPYESTSSKIRVLYKEDLSFSEMNNFIADVQPSLLYVSGWGDKEYNKLAKQYIGKIPVVLGMDNPWTGTLKQRAAAVLAPTFLKRIFNCIWVAGMRQYEFARRLGFKHEHILKGLYCADFAFAPTKLEETRKNGRQLLFVGRFVEYKRASWLVNALCEFYNENRYPHWSALLIGNGPLKNDLARKTENYKQIRFMDFVQPFELTKFYREASAFCLPSINEHWGLVIHEAALAGLPMLLSDSCGASEEFLIPGYNGYSFKSGSYESFKRELGKLMDAPDNRLQQMSAASLSLSQRITHDSWSATLLSVLNK